MLVVVVVVAVEGASVWKHLCTLNHCPLAPQATHAMISAVGRCDPLTGAPQGLVKVSGWLQEAGGPWL